MDPYLEGYLWSDVHNALASKIRTFLVPQLRPKYAARLEVYVVEDISPSSEIGILYPDVEVLQIRQRRDVTPTTPTSNIATTPAPLTLPVIQPVEVRIPTVEIRDTANNVLVSCIEILSPVNKREPGITDYRKKRQRLYNANVHLELQAVLNAIYDEAGYDLSIDYTQPPPPPVLSDADIEWMYKRLGKSSL